MAGIYSQGGSAGHRYAGWLSEVEAKNFIFGGKVFNGSPSAIYVGSKMVWPSGWLTFAAVQAILGAFGQRDGLAVINATNAYLNQLAASGQAGKDKAQQIADWLNAYAVEDAHIVYSLVPTLNVFRCLVFTGTQYISTGVKLSDIALKQGAYVNLLMQWTSFTPNGYQVNGWGSNPQIGISVSSGNAKWQNYATGTQNLTLNAIYNVKLELDAAKSVLKCDGFNDLTAGYNTVLNDYPFFVGCMTSNGTSGQNFAKETIGRVIVQGETKLREMYPFIRNGVNGMIDVLDGTFYANAGTGSFTISETPSTP